VQLGFAHRFVRAFHSRLFGRRDSWSALRLLPPVTPTQGYLDALRRSEWPDYQRWLRRQSLPDVDAWLRLRQESLGWRRPPRISLVTPTYNSGASQLEECLLSVRCQSYPFWQLCLVDDCSTRADVLPMLEKWARWDPRIQVGRLERHAGICAATNLGIEMAKGDYVGFLDHDDMLAPDALHRFAQAMRADPAADVLYSDRDMLSVQGNRFRHLLKPAWSPETLLAGNYLFHLTVYRRTLLTRLSGLQAGYEGSQDYDLILRAAEATDRIRHVPRVLYHWREHAASIATNTEAKRYVYDAGKAALSDALRRRGFEVPVSDVAGFRGHYRGHLPPPDPETIAVLRLGTEQARSGYAQWLRREVSACPASIEHLLVLGPGVSERNESAFGELLQWLRIPGVGLTTGRVVTTAGRLAHVGLVQRLTGLPLALYQGLPATEPGYMAYAAVMRNVSAPHPWCVGFRRELWNRLEGLSADFLGPHAMLDLALRGLAAGWRTVYVPYAEFVASDERRFIAPWLPHEAAHFSRVWRHWLDGGDPYFPFGMALDAEGTVLAQAPPTPPVLR
jgi:glycosyltransferase involved in cell wall biosynthesis